MRIEDFLRRSAALRPDRAAVVSGTEAMSYADLDARSEGLAASLRRHGVARGDRVAVFADNCPEAVIAIFGILKAGAAFCPVNHATKADKLAYVLRNCRATAVITQGRLSEVASQAMADAPEARLAVVSGPGARPSAFPVLLDFAAASTPAGGCLPGAGIDLDLAMLVYTSGSTGRPKGVMMTHRNVEAASASITSYLSNTPDDVIVNVLPISFDYGLYQVIMAVHLGATLVLEKSFAFPAAVFETMRARRVTGLPLVPSMAAMILRMRDLTPGFLPDLRYVTNTAAALPPDHISRLRTLFPGVALYSMYGLTECKRCTWLPPSELDRRPGSVGIAIPGTEAYVVADDGRSARADEVGELVIRGPHVMQGYWEDPEATARALRPGPYPWERVLHTGDLFRTDADGFLYFVGRKDDIIKSGGEKVAPKEVEAVLHGCPGVAEAVVVGRPDPVLGHAVHAIVVASRPGLGAREVIRHCALRLEPHMVPRSVEFRDDLPRTDTGKVSRRLAAVFQDAAE